MSSTTLFAMLSFSFVMSITPGPVNVMIISSGINHGFKNTFSFISGATIGFTLLFALIGLGLHSFLNTFPSFFIYLEVLGSSFIIYMGYKIATSTSSLEQSKKENKKLRFYEGFLLQWLNPKAWIASVSGVSMFVSGDKTLIIFIFIYFIICYLSLSFWGILGDRATTFFSTSKRLKVLNITMGGLLIFSAVSLLVMNL